jgi:hypothetical protein
MKSHLVRTAMPFQRDQESEEFFSRTYYVIRLYIIGRLLRPQQKSDVGGSQLEEDFF